MLHIPAEAMELNTESLKEQKAVLERKQVPIFPIEPYVGQSYFDDEQALGLEVFKTGALGCLIVAGGQGTRAKLTQPKALFPISNIKHKSFLQLFAEKTRAASKLAGVPLQLAIMTSPLNDAEIRKFIRDHDYFGLKEDQVDFFTQEMLPFLDEQGETFLSAPDQIAMGPNGNGLALKEFVTSGTFDKWQKKGVKYLNFIMIDNALADPFDLSLLDFHVKHNAELTLKCIERDNATEKLGLIVKSNEHVKIVEYSEAPKEVFGDIETYSLGNISLFMINLETIRHIAKQKLPLHLAYKPTPFYDPETGKSESKFAWKFEYFIFDILAFIKNVNILVYPKHLTFAPLKSTEDTDKVQLALLENDRLRFASITQSEPPSTVFELDQEFYYPTEEFKERWRGQKAPLDSYIY